MGFGWNLFDSNRNIKYSILGSTMDLLVQTAKKHAERDLASCDVLTLLNLVNGTSKGDNPADTNTYNWMKVHYGANDNLDPTFEGKGDIAIVYRLIQHRKYMSPGQMQWSVSVGFDQRLLPTVPPTTADEIATYAKLAVEVAKAIRAFLPTPSTFIVIDTIPQTGDNPRVSRIANLFDVAKSLKDSPLPEHKELLATWSAPASYTPMNKEGHPIPGYDPNKGDVYVTSVTTK